MWEQLKQGKATCERWLCDDYIFTLIILVVVAVASFGLGRMSVAPTSTSERPVLVPTPVEVQAAAQVAVETAGEAASGQFVASVNGTKYHALSCPGAKQISEQNKIYFQTTDEARAAGYTPAANCSF